MLLSKSKYWDFCSVLAGIAFTFSFSPFDHHYFSPAALLFLGAACLHLNPGRAFLRGYLFGLGQFGLGVSWVFVSVHQYGGASIGASILLTSLFVGFWALFPGLAAFLAAVVPVTAEHYRVLAFSFVWILTEYLRGCWILDGFPWLQIAYSQMDSPLSGYIPLMGSYGTGFLASLTASLVLLFIKTKTFRLPVTCLLVSLWGGGIALQSHHWTYPVGSPIQAVLIQGNIPQDQKWRPEFRQSTLMQYKSMTAQHWGADVIVWPETSVPAWLNEVKEDFIDPLSQEAKQQGTDLIISAPVRGSSANEKFNAVITLGAREGVYRKVHLLPFGEYLPWQPLSGMILKKMKLRLGNFTPGTSRQPLLKAGGYPFIPSICYEDVFSDRAIAGLPEAAYLVNVTNDGWFGDSIEPYQHMQLARMRTMETGRFLLRATNTGLTGIVGPDGKIVSQAPLFEATTLAGKITPMGGMTPFAKIGDKPVIYWIAAGLCLIVIFEKRTAKKNPRSA